MQQNAKRQSIMHREIARFCSFRAIALSALLASGFVGGLPAPVFAQSAAPAITYFVCPLNIENGNFECEVGYSSASPAKVSWSVPGTFSTPPGSSALRGRCTPGRPYRVSVTIHNTYGTATQSTTFSCF